MKTQKINVLKLSILYIYILIISTILYSCSNVKEAELVKYSGKVFGSTFSISYYDTENRNFQKEIDSLFGRFNTVFSTYDSTSMISKINQNQSVELNDWFKEVFKISDSIYILTNGAFDPTVAPLVNAWGFGKTNAQNMSKTQIDSLLEFVGFNKIKIIGNKLSKNDNRLMLDFNAIAPGYCSDVIASFLESKSITSYLVEIGGEIASKGKKPDNSLWKVGIEKPTQSADDSQSVMQTLNISDKALATSGNYRKYFEKDGKRFSHEIDPKTGYPEENNLLSVTVITDRCILADAYATTFMVMGLEKAFAFAEKDKTLEAFFIYNDENNLVQTKYTKGFGEYMAK